MYYVLTNAVGIFEVRCAPLTTIPADATPISEPEYNALMRGTYLWQAGSLVPNPNPPQH